MPSLHHTPISHSLTLTNRTTSRSPAFLPIHLSLLSRWQVLSLAALGALSCADILGSSHKWLTKPSINYSAEDSRDLPPLSSPLWQDSSNVKPASGSGSARR